MQLVLMKKQFRTVTNTIELENPFSKSTTTFTISKRSLVDTNKSRNRFINKKATELQTTNYSLFSKKRKEEDFSNSGSFLDTYAGGTLLDLLSVLKENLISEQKIDIREILIALSNQVKILGEDMKVMKEYLDKRDKKVSLVHSKMLA